MSNRTIEPPKYQFKPGDRVQLRRFWLMNRAREVTQFAASARTEGDVAIFVSVRAKPYMGMRDLARVQWLTEGPTRKESYIPFEALEPFGTPR